RSFLISTAISSSLVSQVYASSQFSFFEHSSCNAGTAFYQLTDPNPLTSDLNCHQMPNGSVAIYISDIDEGCTLRTYDSATCSPSTISGLLLAAGTCFYTGETEHIGSWRADCVGIAYTDSNGDDHGNSYSSDAGNAEVVDILATATGPVTVTQTNGEITKTVIPVKPTSSTATASSTDGAAEERASGSGTASATMSAATTSMSSLSSAGSRQKGLVMGMSTPAGIMLAIAGLLG
ncbi:uncharacterized protein A1O9_07332, partial [Exophiala aquamarina CBS 119918]